MQRARWAACHRDSSIIKIDFTAAQPSTVFAKQVCLSLQEGCEYLILTDSAGRLDLRDVYVHDLELDIYARPTVSGAMPETPLRYAEVPWTVQYTGDSVYGKAPWQRVSAWPIDLCPHILLMSPEILVVLLTAKGVAMRRNWSPVSCQSILNLSLNLRRGT